MKPYELLLKLKEALIPESNRCGYEMSDRPTYGTVEALTACEFHGFTIEQVDANGGYGGGGEHMDVTYKITGDDLMKYLRLTGYYSSWDDSEWHTMEFVEPYEKTVTFYRPCQE